MNKEQREARLKFMAAEAERLIEARRRVQRPANAVTISTNQHYDPKRVMVDVGKVEANRVAAQVIAALARRDRGSK